MSSNDNNNNENTVINSENDATISNQNHSIHEEVEENHQTSEAADDDSETLNCLQRTFQYIWSDLQQLEFSLTTYLSLMLLSSIYGIYNIFPVLLPISFCSGVLALKGDGDKIFQLLIPFMLTVVIDVIYTTICLTILCSFKFGDDEFLLNKFLYDYWPETAKKFAEISMGAEFVFNLYLAIMLGSIILGIASFFLTKQRYSQLYEEIIEEQKEKYLYLCKEEVSAAALARALDGLRGRNLLRQQRVVQREEETSSSEETSSDESSEYESQNPYANLLAEFPPPPSYQDIISTPQNGIPPPTYNMLESEEPHHLNSTSIAPQQLINNQTSNPVAAQETINASNNVLNEALNESIAISPLSLAEFPPPPSYQDILSTPQNGIPPPIYSMLESEGLNHLNSTSITPQQSINNQSFDTTAALETINSSNNFSNESTAMSPSSVGS